MLLNLKSLLERTEGNGIIYVVFSFKHEVCEIANDLNELKMILKVHRFTVEEMNNGELIIFAFNCYQVASDLCDYFEGYKCAIEAMKDFEDYVVDLDYQAYIDGRPLTAEQEDWIKSERFDLNAKIERYEVDLQIMIQNLISRV